MPDWFCTLYLAVLVNITFGYVLLIDCLAVNYRLVTDYTLTLILTTYRLINLCLMTHEFLCGVLLYYELNQLFKVAILVIVNSAFTFTSCLFLLMSYVGHYTLPLQRTRCIFSFSQIAGSLSGFLLIFSTACCLFQSVDCNFVEIANCGYLTLVVTWQSLQLGLSPLLHIPG